MMNFRKLFGGIFCLAVGIVTMVSCEKDASTDSLNATVDVFVQDLKADATIKYGVVVYVTANYEIKSAKVTAPGTGGKVYELKATANKKQFVLIPVAADYTAEVPAKGDYTFEIISTTDEKITGKDAVGDEKLAPISIKTAVIANHLLKTTWDKIQNTDAYVVNFYSADKSERLFSSSFITSDKAEYEFGSTTQGWATGKSPVANTNYVVELIGVKYETGISSDKGNNIQFVTLDSKTIKWE